MMLNGKVRSYLADVLQTKLARSVLITEDGSIVCSNTHEVVAWLTNVDSNKLGGDFVIETKTNPARTLIVTVNNKVLKDLGMWG